MGMYMPTKKIPAGEFKQRCLSLMDHVAETGTEYVITKRGTEVCRIAPLKQSAEKRFGLLKGSVTIKCDLTAPTGENWEANE